MTPKRQTSRQVFIKEQTKKQDHQVLLKTNYLVFVLFLFAKAKDCQTSHQAATNQT